MSRKGIEIDPKKVKVIMDMPPPKNIKQIKSLQGNIQAIKRFIAQLTNKIALFSYLLKKGNKYVKTEECQKAFDDIKRYLLHPHIFPLFTPCKS